MCNIDDVSSNGTSPQFGAMLYISEDNEAVIKMINKGTKIRSFKSNMLTPNTRLPKY